MQKKIIALAVAAVASGAAFAQSNVTISGEIKTQINQVSANGAAATTAAGFAVANPANATARTRVDNGTSKLTFKGEEALGNGLKAVFQIDSDVGSDRVAGSIFGSRETYVGLSGNWGTFLMGRLNAHYNQMAGIDANGIANGLGLQTSSLNLFGATGLTNQGATGTARGTRLDNVMAYVSPNMNGFSGMFALTGLTEATTSGLAAKDRGWNLAVKFANGPINAAYSLYNVKAAGSGVAANGVQGTCTTNGTATAVANAAACAVPGVFALSTANGLGTDYTSSRFGAAYAFPMGLKVGFIFDRSEQETSGVANSDTKRTSWSLPMSYNMAAHTFYFTYGRAANITGNAAATVAMQPFAQKSDYRMTMLAYSYDLSKRTQVNASWTNLQNGIASSADFWHGNTAVAGGQGAGADPTSLAVGIRHSF
ncbi:MAG: porin [Gammaproteobacteria bacterium]|nr:porin [Gammaproteobacteria bacterium]MBU1645978.1 porin [Gammaproteobacteria bacterium]MBU1972040.1 porin [Gammaproteobacteria bacterium]